jgi:hypothetical protein
MNEHREPARKHNEDILSTPLDSVDRAAGGESLHFRRILRRRNSQPFDVRGNQLRANCAPAQRPAYCFHLRQLWHFPLLPLQIVAFSNIVPIHCSDENALAGFLAGMVVMGGLTFAVAQGRHPHIHAAVGALQAAQQELREAAHDFCGHRAQALKDTDAALRQLRLALECNR